MKPAAKSSEADIEALDALCDRLEGFGCDAITEWVDGALAALVAGPRTVMPSEWLPLVFGDAWERAIADPDDLQQSLGTLMRRWNVIADQLHPQRLFDEPDQMHFLPLLSDFSPERRDELLAEGTVSIEDAADWPLTGQAWARGFLSIASRLVDDWMLPDGSSDAVLELASLVLCIEALAKADAAELQADLAIRYPAEAMDRDALVDEARFAVQDLRCFWLEHATRTAPRRVDKAPGRNDPCPCGSGKKYKKCHGAADAVH